MGKWDQYAVEEVPTTKKWAQFETPASHSGGLTGPTTISATPRLSLKDVFPMTSATAQVGRKLPAAYGAGLASDVLNLLGMPANVAMDVAGRTGSGRGQQPLGQTLRSGLRGGEQTLEQGQPSRIDPFVKAAVTAPFMLKAPPVQQAGRELATAVESTGLPNPIQFLKGSPKLVNQAERDAHTLIQSFRQGGKAHEPFFEKLGQVSEEAWAPMKQLATAVGDQPTSLPEVVAEVARLHPDDPQMVKEIATILRGTAGKQASFNGPELEAFSSQIGKATPKGVLQGRMPPRQAQQFKAEARTAISNLLEQKAPAEFKGFASQAKQQWSSYKSIQQKLYDILSPGASKESETKAGVAFFKRAASGELTQTEQEFLNQILPGKFPDLAQGFQTLTKQMGKALGRKHLGEASRQVGLYGGGGAALISYLLGRRPAQP